MFGFSGCSDAWFLVRGHYVFFIGAHECWRISDIDRGSSFCFFEVLDCFRLLIQRCKRSVEIENLFDKRDDPPDESADCPTNERRAVEAGARGY
jgi:hypothetical protein